MTNDLAFSRVDGQGAGLKKPRTNARAVVEVRKPALLWERWVDGETSRGRRTRKGENCCGTRNKFPENHVAPVSSPAPPLSLNAFPTPSTADSNQMSKQLQFKLVLLGAHPSRAIQLTINTGIAGESAVGKSRCFPLSHIRPPHSRTPETHPPSVWFSDLSKISLTITGKAPSGVRDVPVLVLAHRSQTSMYTSAAFLTQTVSLDDNTTVKFEIWYIHSPRNRRVIF